MRTWIAVCPVLLVCPGLSQGAMELPPGAVDWTGLGVATELAASPDGHFLEHRRGDQGSSKP